MLTLGVAAFIVAGVIAAVIWSSGSAPTPDIGRDAEASPPPSAGGTSISPVRSVVPAETPDVDINYTVGNLGETAQTFELSAVELDENGSVITAQTGGAGSWVSFDQPTLTVATGQSQPVVVQVRAPADRGVEERRVGVAVAQTTAASGDGPIGVRTVVMTSVYIQGTGTPVRAARLENLAIPAIATGPVPVEATLVNDGTVTVVPGAVDGTAQGTITDGTSFALTGDPVRPASSGRLVGTVTDTPAFCWCEIAAAVDDGNGQASIVSARVLIAPLWALISVPVIAALTLLALGLRFLLRRTRQRKHVA